VHTIVRRHKKGTLRIEALGRWLGEFIHQAPPKVDAIRLPHRRNPAPHDRAKYKWCNLIDLLLHKLKNWRCVATRCDKTKEYYLGIVALASGKL
jgi:transposase